MQSERKTILVVDDERRIGEVITDALQEEGYHVTFVRNGAEAMAYLKSGAERPRLILLDMMMPDMSGWQFRDAQQHDETVAEIPVVVMSANLYLAQATHTLGVTEYLNKPFELAQLLDVVVRYCGPARETEKAAPPIDW